MICIVLYNFFSLSIYFFIIRILKMKQWFLKLKYFQSSIFNMIPRLLQKWYIFDLVNSFDSFLDGYRVQIIDEEYYLYSVKVECTNIFSIYKFINELRYVHGHQDQGGPRTLGQERCCHALPAWWLISVHNVFSNSFFSSIC